MVVIDTHCHLADEKLLVEPLIKKMDAAEVDIAAVFKNFLLENFCDIILFSNIFKYLKIRL